ncbi:MAG: MoaD/ThiS family protein [Thermoleophilia bacterium]|nr:MoaD/ThiS family protein [Thermoleophilia bacterium]
MSLAGPRTMREILADLGVPHGLVMGVIVQGRRYGLDYVPADGDEVTLISPPAGG